MLRTITSKLFHLKLREPVIIPFRERGGTHYSLPKPRKRLPVWFVRKNRTIHEDYITPANKEFIAEGVSDRYGAAALIKGVQTYTKSVDENTLVDIQSNLVPSDFVYRERRCGLIARKIGVVPMWKSDGKAILTTMLQVDDNHVIKYFEPDEYVPAQLPRVKNRRKFGCVLVGAGSADPSTFTKEYCGLFKDSGVMPKRFLGRFLVTPGAKLLPGTPLTVSHFRVGDFVDIRGKTVDRGFQGVMKRWGFKGMPATHGQTKTHRRPGNIGSGGEKARVWPGQKMPGHMGNRYRRCKAIQIVRMNKENGVIYVNGNCVSGELNNIIYIFDTLVSGKRKMINPPLPTSFSEIEDVDVYADGIHDFRSPTITYEEE